MSKEIEDKLKEITDKIVKEIDPEKVILFGSYVWGNPGPDSDIDIAVIENSDLDKRERQLKLGWILIDSGVPTDILSFTPSEIKHRTEIGDFFTKDIINKGKVLYARH